MSWFVFLTLVGVTGGKVLNNNRNYFEGKQFHVATSADPNIAAWEETAPEEVVTKWVVDRGAPCHNFGHCPALATYLLACPHTTSARPR